MSLRQDGATKAIIYAVVGVFCLFLGLPPQAKSSCNSILNASYGWEIEQGLIAAGNTPGLKVGDFFPSRRPGTSPLMEVEIFLEHTTPTLGAYSSMPSIRALTA
jgi:hypothetical protein